VDPRRIKKERHLKKNDKKKEWQSPSSACTKLRTGANNVNKNQTSRPQDTTKGFPVPEKRNDWPSRGVENASKVHVESRQIRKGGGGQRRKSALNSCKK